MPGRTIGLVCLIEDKPAVLIVDLPRAGERATSSSASTACTRSSTRTTTASSSTTSACRRRTCSAAARRRPDDRLSRPEPRPRRAVCQRRRHDAADAGQHAPLGQVPPDLRRRRSPRANWSSAGSAGWPGLIVGCDALVAWCAGLIDQGYRGELECIIAKIFGSEAQKEAAIELFMKTHGGRSFLHGHIFGDNVHEYLAPCIYEGEGEMLGMAFFKSLVKQHGKTYFEPIGKALAAAGIQKPNPLNPAHAWALKGVALPYVKWVTAQTTHAASRGRSCRDMPKNLREHAEFAAERLQRSPLEIAGTMSKLQLKLADRQCRMAELSQRCKTLITILCTSLYARRQHGRSRPRRRRHALPGPDAQAHRPAAQRPLLPHGHEAGRSDRRRRLPARSPV